MSLPCGPRWDLNVLLRYLHAGNRIPAACHMLKFRIVGQKLVPHLLQVFASYVAASPTTTPVMHPHRCRFALAVFDEVGVVALDLEIVDADPLGMKLGR